MRIPVSKYLFGACCICLVLAVFPADSEEPVWWKGNIHAHSLWSDGVVYPEQAVAYYRDRGYNFLALTDHDILCRDDLYPAFETYLEAAVEEAGVPREVARGMFPEERDGRVWMNVTQRAEANSRGGDPAILEEYLEQFGASWVEIMEVEGDKLVRLKPINEFRHLFEAPGEFLLIDGVEISGITPVHMLAINPGGAVAPYIPTAEPGSTVDIINGNLRTVAEAPWADTRTHLVVLAHPNYMGGVTAEHLIEAEGLQFFEVFNGHRSVRNHGDAYRKDTDRMWDIALAHRLSQGQGPLLYGFATDDAHSYHNVATASSSPERGWLMVRASYLTPESIVGAIQDGAFYATTGVTLRDIRRDERALTVEVEPEPDVRYTIQFIGTREGVDLESEPVHNPEGEPMTTPRLYTEDFVANWEFEEDAPYAVTRRYSEAIGTVLLEIEGTEATYEFAGDELYVRAKIVSDKLHPNPFAEGDVEVAWVQPVVPEPAS